MSARRAKRLGAWAVVTGASDGIGLSVAEQLGAAGINLVLVARRRAVLEQVAVRLAGAHGIEARVLDLDLANPGAPAALEQATAALDVGMLVAAAGYGTSGPLIGNALADELDMLDVNCRAVLALAHGFGRRFAARGRGALVLMSSLVAFQGVPRAANYAATKAYVQTLAEGLALELKPHGVDVLAVAPGPVRSGFGQRARMRISAGQTPDSVARGVMAALGRSGTVRPGLLSKLLEASLMPLPRRGRTRIMARIMAGMTGHRDADGATTPQPA